MLVYGAGASWSRLFYPGAALFTLEPPFLPWICLFYPGAGADPSMLEPESAPAPWTTGAGFGAWEKSGGTATLVLTRFIIRLNVIFFV